MNEQTTERPPEKWAIVEIMGHRVIAGRLAWGDVPFDKGIAVDVPLPAPPDELARGDRFLQEFYGAGSIFSVRIVPEQLARQEAEQSWHVKGVARALLPAPARAAAEQAEREAAMAPPRPAGRDEIYRYIDARLANGDYDEIMLPESPRLWDDRLEQRADELSDLYDDDGDLEDPQQRRRALARLAAEAVAAVEAHDRMEAQREMDDRDGDEPEEGADETGGAAEAEDDLPV